MLFLAVLGGRWLIAQTPDRFEVGLRSVAVRFTPVRLAADGFAPLKLAGAWTVSVDDARFGGLSALAIDGNSLLALTDAGVVVRLPMPGRGNRAVLRELPDGPGDPAFKRYRDSEALARDPRGGWWVAFENRHSLWKYDERLQRVLGKRWLSGGAWDVNEGIEGIAFDGNGLLLFPETAASVVTIRRKRIATRPLEGFGDRIADAASLPDGRAVVLLREPTWRGFRNSLAWLDRTNGRYRLSRLANLGVGMLDNMEGVAAEPTATGTRLWLVSDNNFHRAQRTLLLALDLPADR